MPPVARQPRYSFSSAAKSLREPQRLARRAGTILSTRTCHGPMTDNHHPFAEFDLERAIALRWALRDIKAKRLKLSPLSDADLRALIELELVEMRDDVPVLTNAGHAVLD